MAFSDAFARGYSVGTDLRKRRAASKFFKEFKELTKEDDEEIVAPDGAAIPVTGGEAEATPAEPVATEAIPVDKQPAVAVDSGATSPTEETPVPEQAAIPMPAEAPTPTAPTPEAAAAAAQPQGAIQELIAGKKEARDAKTGGEKFADQLAAKKSLTQNDIKKLDRLALKAAEAAGDIEVYTALQRTTDSFLQGKVQKYLGMAQVAAQNGEQDAVEKYLTKAYRFVPDGEEVKFTKKDGQLFINNPWYEEGSKDPKEIPLGAEQIAYMSVMISDPQKWGDIVRQEKALRREEARKERGVAVEERRTTAYENLTNAQIDNMAEKIGLDRKELGLKDRAQRLAEAMAPVERLAKYQQALYYSALSEQAKSAGKTGGLTMDQLIDNALSMGKEVEKQFADYTTPPTNPITGMPDKNWKPPENVAGLSPQHIQVANGLAQSIGAANMQSGDVGPGVAVAAGLALAKAGAKDADGNPLGAVDVDAKNGTMTFDYNGTPTTVKLPGAVLQSLMAVQAERARGAAAGLPGPAQFQDPFAQPEPLFGQQP